MHTRCIETRPHLGKQEELEQSLQEKQRTADENPLINDDVVSSSKEEEANPMSELLSKMAVGDQSVKKKTNEAIESSESGDSDEDDKLGVEELAGGIWFHIL